SFRRPHQLFQSEKRRAQKRRDTRELQSQHPGALAAYAGRARQAAYRDRRAARRGHRRNCQAEGNHHRRNAWRQGCADQLPADAEGKHKKQSGGHGQFGVCRIRMEPIERGKGIEFVDDVFGGAIPKNWIPSVEKGIRDSAARGYLAGFPVTDFRAILYDGKYHDVDSSDIAFKIAGSLAFKEAMKQARPALLEPIMNVEVYAPDQYSGDLMGDLSSRRGRISGSEARGHN